MWSASASRIGWWHENRPNYLNNRSPILYFVCYRGSLCAVVTRANMRSVNLNRVYLTAVSSQLGLYVPRFVMFDFKMHLQATTAIIKSVRIAAYYKYIATIWFLCHRYSLDVCAGCSLEVWFHWPQCRGCTWHVNTWQQLPTHQYITHMLSRLTSWCLAVAQHRPMWTQSHSEL